MGKAPDTDLSPELRSPSRPRAARLLAAATVAVCALASGQATAAPGRRTPLAQNPTGSSAEWAYVRQDRIVFDVVVPGARVVGEATDILGSRKFSGQVIDTAADGKCVVGVVFDAEEGNVASEEVCDGQPVPFETEFAADDIEIIALRLTPTREVETRFSVNIPSSQEDPRLRVAGNGAAVVVSSPSQIAFSVVRGGATLNGNASGLGTGSVSVQSTLTSRNQSGQCAYGRFFHPGGSLGNMACTQNQSVPINGGPFSDLAQVQVCSDYLNPAETRCLLLERILPEDFTL